MFERRDVESESTNSHPPMANRIAAMRANATARRSRMDTSRSPLPVAEPIADAADGLEVVAAERCVDLRAKIANVLVDDVGRALIGEVPHGIDDLRSGQHRACMA